MPKFRASLVRKEIYVVETEFEANDMEDAFRYASNALSSGVDFDGDIAEADEYINAVIPLEDE